ncbi:MAG: hypothetical protein HY391_01715 [Deltaproteobacteria bacterium]|nr:hypothetical protein [Deltaproteobacteria bacterium]
MRKTKLFFPLVALFLLAPTHLLADQSIESLQTETLVRIAGVVKNQFGTEPQNQLGSIMIVKGGIFVEQLALRLGADLQGETVIQVTGRLAQIMRDRLSAQGHGEFTYHGGVLYCHGELAEQLEAIAREVYARVSDSILEGVSFFLATGSEALTLLDVFCEEMRGIFDDRADLFGQIVEGSYEDATSWLIRFLHLGFEFDADGAVVWNPLFAYDMGLEGVEKIAAHAGDAFLFTFDSFGTFFSYLAGNEENAFATAFQRTTAVIGETGNDALYIVSDFAGGARGLFHNPFTAITLVSEAATRFLDVGGSLVDGTYEIVTGFVTQTFEQAAAFANGEECPIGAFIIVAGEEVERLFDAGRGVLAIFRNLGENTWNVVLGFFEPFSSFDSVQDFITDLGDAFRKVIELGQQFFAAIQDLIDQLRDLIGFPEDEGALV